MPTVQRLENRRLFSGDPFTVTSKRTLQIEGTAGDDAIHVQLKGNKRAYGFLATFGAAEGNSQPTSVTYTFNGKFYAVKRIYVDGHDGDDQIFIDGGPEMTRPVTVLGGPGDDVIDCDNAGAAYINGGAGDDKIGPQFHLAVASSRNKDVLDQAFQVAAGAVNTIMGGSGADILSGDPSDIIDGGVGDAQDVGIVRLFSHAHISANRAAALAHDYFRRLSAVHLEVLHGAIGPFGD